MKAIAVEIGKMALAPGDVVVVRTPNPLTTDQLRIMGKDLQTVLPDGVKCLVLAKGTQLEVYASEGVRRDGRDAPKPLTVNDLEVGKRYFIPGNGGCEYLGLDHFYGETTCKFKRLLYRDYYYEAVDKVPMHVFLEESHAVR